MSDHDTSPLHPEADDLLQVSSQYPTYRPFNKQKLTHPHRQRSPIPSQSLPTSLASLPHIPNHNHHQSPPPPSPVPRRPLRLPCRLPPSPSRPQNKRPGGPSTRRKSSNGASRARTCARAPRPSVRGGRNAVRASAGKGSRRRGDGRCPRALIRAQAWARASGRPCRGGARASRRPPAPQPRRRPRIPSLMLRIRRRRRPTHHQYPYVSPLSLSLSPLALSC